MPNTTIRAQFKNAFLVKDPEFVAMGQKQVLKLRIKAGQWAKGQDVAKFYDVLIWEPKDDFIARFSKGDDLYVEGRMRITKWVDRNGVAHDAEEISAYEEDVFVMPRAERAQAAAAPAVANPASDEAWE